MRLSKKGEYAIRALIELGLESSEQGQLLQIATVAKRTNIPEKFLEQILLALKNGGFLKSKRGVDGGYCLNRPAEEIMLGDIIRLMDGPLAPIPCVSTTAHKECNCPDMETCGLRIAMQEVRDAIARILDSYSLATVVNEVRRRHACQSAAWQFDI